jgi:predicted RNase H-like HicB family nuclease
MDQYSVVVQYSDEDEGYIAIVPELRGLSAFGESREDALKELEIAKKLYLEVFQEDGCDLPEPQKTIEFSGQLRLRFPKSLHSELSREAEREGVSLNSHMIRLLAERNLASKIDKKLDTINNHILGTIVSQSFDRKPKTSCTEFIRCISTEDEADDIQMSCH